MRLPSGSFLRLSTEPRCCVGTSGSKSLVRRVQDGHCEKHWKRRSLSEAAGPPRFLASPGDIGQGNISNWQKLRHHLICTWALEDVVSLGCLCFRDSSRQRQSAQCTPPPSHGAKETTRYQQPPGIVHGTCLAGTRAADHESRVRRPTTNASARSVAKRTAAENHAVLRRRQQRIVQQLLPLPPLSCKGPLRTARRTNGVMDHKTQTAHSHLFQHRQFR